MNQGVRRILLDQSWKNQRIERGWGERRRSYVCRDGEPITVPRRSAEVGDLNKAKMLPANAVCYAPRSELRITVSEMRYDRCMTELFGASKGIRTIIFPSTVRAVYPGSFSWLKSLRAALMNEGLETLGNGEDDKYNFGVFKSSGIRKVRLPSTLRRIEHDAFWGCSRLRSITLPEELQYIGSECFYENGLESVRIPSTLKTIE